MAIRQAAARITFVRAALVAGFAVVVAQSIAHFLVTLGANLGFDQSDSTFDLERSNGVPDVISAVVIVAAAVGAVVLAGGAGFGRMPAAGLALVLLVIGADDTLHTGDRASAYGFVVIGTLLTAATLASWVALRTTGAARTCLLVGLVLLVLDVKAPFAYDQLMNAVGQPALVRGDFLYELGVVLDEGTELMGWVLVAVGLWDVALAGRTTSARRPDIALDMGQARR
jgi:hypothetical protein